MIILVRFPESSTFTFQQSSDSTSMSLSRSEAFWCVWNTIPSDISGKQKNLCDSSPKIALTILYFGNKTESTTHYTSVNLRRKHKKCSCKWSKQASSVLFSILSYFVVKSMPQSVDQSHLLLQQVVQTLS